MAAANFEYIYYSTPNKAVVDTLDEDLISNVAVVPTDESIENCEVYEALDPDTTNLMNELWKEIKSE